MDSRARFGLWYVIATFIVIALLQGFYQANKQSSAIPYSEFRALLDANKIDKVWVAQNDIEGVLKQPDKNGTRRFSTTRVDPALAAELDKHKVTYFGEAPNTWLPDILSWILPTLLFFGVWMLVIRRFSQQGGGLMSIGKSRAKIYVEKDTKVAFADVAGVDEAKEELKEVVDFLRDSKAYGRLGARAPKGVLLVGPPGTGKTLLARAVAGEAGVKFFSISGSEFVEMFVGVGAARVRDLFEQARKEAPAIIFIDELDALGGVRGAYAFGGHAEKEQTLNQLLVELDGFDPSIGVILIGATNRPEILDPALLRAGRFDRQVLVDRPDKKGRIAILQVHMKKAVLATNVDPERIAELTPGFTGADLANLVNEAALLATRRRADSVELRDFTAAVERIIAGLEKRNRILIPKERQIVAYHELGHAIMAMSLPGQDPVHKISIIPRGIGALGYTIQRPTEDRFLMTQEELDNRMAVLLGGRAAELVFFQHLSTGAADDLVKATDIARSMVLRFGMDQKLGHVAYERERPPLFTSQDPRSGQPREFSDETDRLIDHAVRDLVGHALERAVAIVTANRAVHEKTAELLLQKETLEEEDIEALRSQVASVDAATNADPDDKTKRRFASTRPQA
ncbi:ATP-dependent zinc metalloprotease FtsH [Bradyrhizobium sp.]|uniref:ATP-dependent zinc metalloprotease FtsH n=1 Tax=Bradyrhizobium sp. TaxID=376 RepID=UPI002D372B1A|nr:ATP-dependent zinc metalloprotease FtsH [Bradyrhizobium sp.]HZR71300.1 ATP-dependent zinc metalloprotease FtsH [Bradyrhizobium sp.]